MIGPTNISIARHDAALCGVLVTYFPDDGIEERVRAVRLHVEMLVIVDNTGSEDVLDRLKEIAARCDSSLIANRQNLGVATALNQGVAFAREKGTDRVTFFDQDSVPFARFRPEMDAAWFDYAGRAPIGILGCNYRLTGSLEARFSTIRAPDSASMDAADVITSGSVYGMQMLARLGGFKDAYFIDGVDIEYCWRAARAGYAVRRTSTPLLEHSLGSPTTRVFLGRRLGTSNHSALRRYYMARNAVWMFKEYVFCFPRRAFRLIGIQFKWAILVAAFETNRSRKLRHAARGFWHGVITRPR